MAVNLAPPDPASLHPVAGVELGVAMAGIKKPNRRDLLVMRFAPGTAVAGVFTRNRFCAAPVAICRKNLRNKVRALQVCGELARLLGCKPGEVLPFSTGVIMEPLPVERIAAGLPPALEATSDWLSAAEAIMTTDTVPKAFSTKIGLSTGEATVTGIAKGAGMIRPVMATMLGFVATDAAVPRKDLRRMLERAAERSFNCITVDGDTSTNDSFVLAATGAGPTARGRKDLALLEEAVTGVSQKLAQA